MVLQNALGENNIELHIEASLHLVFDWEDLCGDVGHNCASLGERHTFASDGDAGLR